MDIVKELQEATKKRASRLEQEKQLLLQEALRLDGEVRVLERLAKEKEV